MTTNDNFILKQLGNSHTDTNNKYNSIHLNRSHQCSTTDAIVISKSNTRTFKAQEIGFDRIKESSSLSKIRRRSLPLSMGVSNISSYLDEKKEKKQKQSFNKTSTTNGSTLSLHIAAYENKINNINSSKINLAEKPTKLKALQPSQIVNASLNNPFIIHRQPNERSPYQIMEFKASQNLFTPNSISSPPLSILPVRVTRPSKKEIKEFIDNNRGLLQGGGPKEQPTSFKFDGQRFVTSKKGSTNQVQFIFGNTQLTSVYHDLPVCSLNWNNGILSMEFMGNKVPEVVQVLKLFKKEKVIEVLTSKTYKGPVSQLLSLTTFDKSDKTDIPTIVDIYNFLTDYNLSSEDKQGAIEEIVVDENVVAEGTAGQEQAEESDTSPPPKKKARFKAVSDTDLNFAAIEQLEKQVVIQNSSLPEPHIVSLPLASLQHDFTIRQLSQSNIDTLLQQMINGNWNPQASWFIVTKRKGFEKYSILDGNHRYDAAIEYNSRVEPSKRIVEVQCKFYRDIDFDQILLILAPSYDPLPQCKLTILQKLNVTRNVVREKNLPTNFASKKLVQKFTCLMKLYFNDDFPVICIELLSLPESLLDQVYTVQLENLQIDQLNLTSNFWKAFISAAKKNPTEALELLQTLDKTTPQKVEQLLKSVEITVLDYLKFCGPHNFATEQEAIEYVTGSKKIGRKHTIQLLKSLDLHHNKGRSKTASTWKEVKDKMAAKLTSDSACVEYIEALTENLVMEQNFIVIQCPWGSLLNILDKSINNSVIVLLSTLGGEAPVLPSAAPTAVFTILMEDPVLIETPTSSLPQTCAKASIYLPGAPENDADKILFLTTLGKEKNCPLAATMALANIHNFGKLSESYDNCLIGYSNEKVAQLLLNKLNYFKKISVVGDPKLKESVSAVIIDSKKKDHREVPSVDSSEE